MAEQQPSVSTRQPGTSAPGSQTVVGGGIHILRKAIASALALTLGLLGVPTKVFAAAKRPAPGQDQGGSINGAAQNMQKQPLANYTVRVRDLANGGVGGSTTSNASGQFSFNGLRQGNYIVEIVDGSGKVVGLSPAVNVPAGASVSVSVTASAFGAIGGSDRGGFGIFGLGTAASVAVIASAGVLTTVGIRAVKTDASPSK